MGGSRLRLFVLALFVSVSASMVPEEDLPAGSYRDGKVIFGKNFWDGFEKGIQNTADILHRVSENLEVAVDQLSDTVGEEFNDMAGRIEDRVEQSLPPFLRYPNVDSVPDEADIEAVSGTMGQDDIEEGLEVYLDEDSEATVDSPSSGLKTDQVAFVDEAKPQGPLDHHFGFGFEGSIFRPFSNFAPFGLRRPDESGSGGGLFNLFRRRQWWNGPNVCIDREEIDEPEEEDTEEDKGRSESSAEESAQKPVANVMFGIGSMQFSSCQETDNKYSCVTSSNKRGISKTVKVVYRCCHGFIRDSSGCTKVDLTETPATLEKVDASDFLSLFKAANLLEALDASNLSIFAPIDEAVQEFMDDLEERNEINNFGDSQEITTHFRNKRDIKDLTPFLLGHLTEGLIYAGDLTDEQVLVSKNREGSTLRINTYASFPPTVTVNCARLLTANQHSISGVVHTIDQVLTPVTRSVADIISTDPQFSILRQLVTKAGLMDQLDQATQLTIFAPTNAAFKSLPANMLDGLMEGTFCLKAVLMNHILPNTICSAAVTSKSKTLNMLDEFLILERSDEDKLFVGGAQITGRDVVTTNGVMHIIDSVLIPQEAKPVVEVLEGNNLTRFLDLIDHADMREELNGYVDVTVFAPSNAAFDALANEEMEHLMNNKEKLREVLRHHVTASALQARDINNNHITTTQASYPLRINLYSRVPLLADIMGRNNARTVKVTAGCSRASSLNSRACGAVVHVVEDILRIPESSIFRQLEKEKSHSMFLQMIKDVGMDKDLESSGPYTVLAPSNHALRTLPEEELAEILQNEDIKRNIVRRHVLYENICCSGINPNHWIFTDRKRAMDNSRIHVRRAPNGKLMADHSRITKCGSPTENGIVHTVNRLLADPFSDERPSVNRRNPFGRTPWITSVFGF